MRTIRDDEDDGKAAPHERAERTMRDNEDDEGNAHK